MCAVAISLLWLLVLLLLVLLVGLLWLLFLLSWLVVLWLLWPSANRKASYVASRLPVGGELTTRDSSSSCNSAYVSSSSSGSFTASQSLTRRLAKDANS